MVCPQLEAGGRAPPISRRRAALCLALQRWSRGAPGLRLPTISQFVVFNARVQASHIAPFLPVAQSIPWGRRSVRGHQCRRPPASHREASGVIYRRISPPSADTSCTPRSSTSGTCSDTSPPPPPCRCCSRGRSTSGCNSRCPRRSCCTACQEEGAQAGAEGPYLPTHAMTRAHVPIAGGREVQGSDCKQGSVSAHVPMAAFEQPRLRLGMLAPCHAGGRNFPWRWKGGWLGPGTSAKSNRDCKSQPSDEASLSF